MREVLISIQPKWCELIASGKKTVEVRKTRPKIDTPFKVYIYETKVYDTLFGKGKPKKLCVGGGKVIGEFVCKDIEEFQAEFTDLMYLDSQNENVCQNTIKRVAWLEDENEPYYFYETANDEDNPNDCELLRKSCLTFDEIRQYIGETFYDKSFYGWCIYDLVIYDEPKELSEFYTIDNEAIKKCEHRERVYNNPNHTNGAWLLGSYICNKDEPNWCEKCKTKPLTKPPQSWCYVEELQN